MAYMIDGMAVGGGAKVRVTALMPTVRCMKLGGKELRFFFGFIMLVRRVSFHLGAASIMGIRTSGNSCMRLGYKHGPIKSGERYFWLH